MANIRYFPNNGTTSDVGGIISTTSRKNTYKLVRIEIDRVTCVKKILIRLNDMHVIISRDFINQRFLIFLSSKFSYLFTTVRWQIKCEHSKEGDPHAWDDEVNRVEKGLSSHRDVESYV